VCPAGKTTMDKLTGIHAVKEALEANRPLEYILVAKGRQDTRAEEIVQLARRNGISVRFEERGQLDRAAGTRDHHGVVAIGAARAAATFDDILKSANKEHGKPGLIVLLDGVEDPHNLGAILRTADAAGADGVVIPERRAAGVTPTVTKASAGASEHLPIAKVTNIGRTLEELKSKNLWIVGLDERAPQNYDSLDYKMDCAIVLGAEGKGVHELVRKKCDFLISIPMLGKVPSLNVSVAAGIMLYEIVRQRRQKTITDSK